MITLSGVSKSFDGRPALTRVHVSVPAGARVALVGPNGSGKSTLLRIAAGLLGADEGTVQRVSGATVGYLPQDYGQREAVGDGGVGDYLAERVGVRRLERRLRALERELADGNLAVAETYGDALDRFEALGGYELDATLDEALDRVGLPASVRARSLSTLSGGQQVRVGLAGLLASRYDVHLLDEPTNNLDREALELLTGFLTHPARTVALVSHDRAFLDAVATDVVVLDEHSHGTKTYGVGYAEFRALRERDRAVHAAHLAGYREEVARLEGIVTRERARAGATRDRRPPRDNDKFARHFFTQRSTAQAARTAQRTEARLARLTPVEEPRKSWDLRLALDAGRRAGDLVVAADRVERRPGGRRGAQAPLSTEAFTLGPVSLTVGWRERVLIDGPNGAGKSTLLRLLTGTERPDAGRIRWGPSARLGLLAQGGVDLAGPSSGLEVFREALGWPEAESRTLLAKFDLGADHALRPVGEWSPGQRCRLGLAILMARGANGLVLDEPTNHLDLEALEELEGALATFEGTLLVVTHDRAFRDALAPTRVITVEAGRVTSDRPA